MALLGLLVALSSWSCQGELAGPAISDAPGGSAGSAGSGGNPPVTTTCAAGTVQCGAECVSLSTNSLHCGACSQACAAGSACSAGVCAGGSCGDTQTDPANCGACGQACGAGQSCVAGACSCLAGTNRCGEACVTLSSDGSNCGACGAACPTGQVCSSGVCGQTCGAGLAACGNSCVSLTDNVANCGSCGNACAPGRTCESGMCHCAGGLLDCGGTCVDTNSSATHCGACGMACSGGRACSNGSCECPAGQTFCTAGEACVNTTSDVQNCGSCGHACTSGQTCEAGNCTGGAPTNEVFSQCRFHFGTTDTQAKKYPNSIAQLDFFTPGWMGIKDTFDQQYVCDEGKSGAVLGNQVPIVVAYVSAFYLKRHHGGLCDCNVSGCGTNDLCHLGAQYIQQDLSAILNVYKSYAQGYANCYGTTRPIIFEMEPDWYQYTNTDTQTDPLTPSEAGNIMGQYVAAMEQYLPNAVFSMDISPWVAPGNGMDNGADWYENFDMSKFTFINTSGGITLGNDSKIRNDNNMTWAGVSQVTGKGILADTGYGAAGTSGGHDANWDSVSNLNARLDDGVISISQYNPNSNWADTIASVRSQLKTPKFCP